MRGADRSGYKSSFALLLPMRCVMFIAVFTLGAAAAGKTLSETANRWSLTASCVNVVTILVLIAAAKSAKMTFGEMIGLHRGGLSVKKTIGLIFIFIAVGMGGMYLSGLVCYGKVMPRVTADIASPIPLALAIVNLIALPATVGFAEDGLYLGLGVNSIKNKYAAVMIPAFFYALQHCFIPMLPDAKYMAYRFISFLPLTVLFCIYYHKKKDPVPIIAAHAILDLATGITILATSSSSDLYEKMCRML